MSVNDSPINVRRRFGFCAKAFFMVSIQPLRFHEVLYRHIASHALVLNGKRSRSFDIGAEGRQLAWCFVMTTVFDIPADIFNPALAKAMADHDAVSMPEWAGYVKTAVDRERPPAQVDWWYARSAAILRKIARNGPIGVTHLAQAFGGKKDNGAMPNTPGVASRHIIRTSLQQLEEAGLVEKVPTKVVEGEDGPVQLYSGRRITAAGQKLVNSVAHSVREETESMYPGLDKY